MAAAPTAGVCRDQPWFPGLGTACLCRKSLSLSSPSRQEVILVTVVPIRPSWVSGRFSDSGH